MFCWFWVFCGLQPRGLAADVVVDAKQAQATRAAAQALISRVVPSQARQFVCDVIPPENGKDVFEVESRDGKIVLRGNNGVAIASALNHYLKTYAHCHVSWCGNQLELPKPLPAVPSRERIVNLELPRKSGQKVKPPLN